MTRLVSLAALTLSIGACAGPRKGADAGGGPTATTGSMTGGTTGSVGAPSKTTGTAPSPPSTPAANTTTPPSGQGSAQGQTCDDGKCAPGLSCVTYYGIAGGAGPKFTSCEIRCVVDGKPGCPSGQNCVTIADGPGAVCRPPDM